MRSEPVGVARATGFEQLSGVFAGCGALHYAKILVSLKIKNGISLTPLNCALNAFTFALNDSVFNSGREIHPSLRGVHPHVIARSRAVSKQPGGFLQRSSPACGSRNGPERRGNLNVPQGHFELPSSTAIPCRSAWKPCRCA